MRDWIKDHKANVERTAESQKADRDERNRIAAVFQVKAPEFWETTLAEVKQQAVEVQQAFPAQAQYRTSFIQTANGFELRRETYPCVTLKADLNATLARLKILKSWSDSAHSHAKESASEATIYLDENEQLHFKFDEGDYFKPEELAEKFVCFVCGITGA